jgi:divalent metal cation (Fe/Co/Zn/Cd) transporter
VITRERYEHLAGRAKLLSWLSLAWMTIELAGALLLGLLGNALVGARWIDPAVGLFIAAVAVKEGVDTCRGESCCAHC